MRRGVMYVKDHSCSSFRGFTVDAGRTAMRAFTSLDRTKAWTRMLRIGRACLILLKLYKANLQDRAVLAM